MSVKILSVDTSSEETSCCVINGENKSVKFEKNKQSHAESLFRLINEAVDELLVKVSEIDYFAVVTGPGSYTGVRIGLSAVKGIAFGNNKPVIGISKFDILANKSGITGSEFIVCFDAKREEVFCQKFVNEKGQTKRVSEPYISNISDLNKAVEKKVCLVAEANNFGSEYIAIDKVDAKDIAEYAAMLVQKGYKNNFPAEPLYIRNVEYVKVTNLRS